MQSDSTNVYQRDSKWCPQCDWFRPLSDFPRAPSAIGSAEGLANRCKTCTRLSQYGLTFAEHEKLRWDQNGLCAICGQPQRKGKTDDLVIDHDHGTGTVRGLLCQPCNLGLGNFEDDIERMEHAIAYVKHHRTCK